MPGSRFIAAVLLAAGADINARGLEFDETPLAAAVRSWLDNKQPRYGAEAAPAAEF